MAGTEPEHGRQRSQQPDGYLRAGAVSPLNGGRMFACNDEDGQRESAARGDLWFWIVSSAETSTIGRWQKIKEKTNKPFHTGRYHTQVARVPPLCRGKRSRKIFQFGAMGNRRKRDVSRK